MAIFRFTSRYEETGPVSFHMPGHKGSNIYSRFGYDGFLRDFPDRDITEIAGADNLFQPEGIIADTMAKYRSLYDAKATYLLVGGSSAGIIASIMTCVRPGGKLILARNCHKSVFNAMRLGGVIPVYVYPDMAPEYGIAGSVDPETIAFAIKENPDASAVILPSPNYYGICSDIAAIADLVHEAGMKLIVDQAHGAHLKLFEKASKVAEREALRAVNIDSGHLTIPPSAEGSGADLVINSTHKTLASLTQSAILNVCGDVDLFDLEDKLQMIQSTSPSYILMESLDINADIMAEHGDQLMTEWYENLSDFYAEAGHIPGLRIMETEGLDPTKINLDMSELGLDGASLDNELMEREIFAELSTGNILMCMTGVGNARTDYEKLLSALKEISINRGGVYVDEDDEDSILWREGMEGFDDGGADHPKESDPVQATQETNTSVWTARRQIHDIPTKSELIPLEGAEGRICATALIPYPPGIPMICPGETVTKADIEHIKTMRDRGEKVIGVDPQGRISVGE